MCLCFEMAFSLIFPSHLVLRLLSRLKNSAIRHRLSSMDDVRMIKLLEICALNIVPPSALVVLIANRALLVAKEDLRKLDNRTAVACDFGTGYWQFLARELACPSLPCQTEVRREHCTGIREKLTPSQAQNAARSFHSWAEQFSAECNKFSDDRSV